VDLTITMVDPQKDSALDIEGVPIVRVYLNVK
jgi:hypothetical protein